MGLVYARAPMNTLRSILFGNLGLKFVALLLAVIVYLNVYTDRPTTMVLSFPIEYTGLADSLSVLGAAPSVVQVELQGTGKQLFMLRIKEPRLKVSLEGVKRGHFERTLAASDLPLPVDANLAVQNLIGPRVIELEVDRRAVRTIPVVVRRVTGMPASGYAWRGRAWAEPNRVRVSGAEQALAALDTLVLAPVRVDGKRDTVTALVGFEALPEGCRAEPANVRAHLLLERRGH